jgi:hypothetical protein
MADFALEFSLGSLVISRQDAGGHYSSQATPTEFNDDSPFPQPKSAPEHSKSEANQAILLRVGDAHAGLLLAPFGQPAAHIVAARIDNRRIHTIFERVVARVAHKAPLTPEQHALFLALGLAQYQTTWSWPPGPHWRAWFTAPAPEHWLPAYVWHLCWAIGDPTNPEHQANAAACLDRGDWPELVAELRDLTVIPPTDDIRALFDGWLPSSDKTTARPEPD